MRHKRIISLFFLLFYTFLCFTSVSANEMIADTLSADVSEEEIVSVVFTFNEPFLFRIYLPMAYRDGNKLPVLYFLHGQGQSETLWERLNIVSLLDEMISDGTIKPMIVVMPREAYYYQDMDESEYPQQVVDQLIPVIEKSFPAITDRSGRGIGGISRGALWAEYIAFEHYDMFSVLGQHSLPNPYFANYTIYRRWQDKAELPLMQILIDTGTEDPYMKGASDFSAQLSAMHYPHTFILSPGDHDEEYWGSHMREYLIWYSHAFEQE